MTTTKTPGIGIRLGSMILDHVFMTIICALFFIPLLSKGFIQAFTISHEQKDFADFSGPLFYIGLFGFALYFCKDCINGRSIAKRITNLQVVDNATGQVASPLKCFVRNIFCIIWPVEVIVTLINPDRRLGDHIAGTKIIAYDPVLISQPKADWKKLILPLALAFGLLVLLSTSFQALNFSLSRVTYIESSYNDAESKALEKLYSDSLGQYLSASVKVYDEIPNEKLKYISVIYRLKENYLADENKAMEIRRVTMLYLYSMFPVESFTGRAQYVYQGRGSRITSSNEIGTSIAIDESLQFKPAFK